MKLTITNEAKRKLEKYTQGYDLLLDFDDGVGPISLEGNCQFDVNFRIIVTDKGNYPEAYEKSFTDNGITLRYKGYSETYMDENMKLDWNPNTFSLKLSGESGILTDSIVVLDDRKKDSQVSISQVK